MRSNEAPLLSVIMGAYRIENLSVFPRCMESILGQSFSDFELLICDDGSPDATWDILSEWGKRDGRIRLFKNEKNQGLSRTLNACLAKARGRYIARHDADDYSAPDRFARQLGLLSAHPEIGFTGTGIGLYDGEKVYARRRFPKFPQREDFLFNDPFVHGSLLFHKECLERAGGYSQESYALRVEDYEMLMRMYAMGIRGANIPEPLYFFLEDEAAQRRRKYRYRIHEAVVRWKGFQRLGLFPAAIPYAVKPLLVGALPSGALKWMKTWYYGD